MRLDQKYSEKQQVILAKRYNREKTSVGFNEIGKIITILDEIQKDMLKIAREKAKENTINISDYSEFKSKIGKGGFFQCVLVWKNRM